jgi:predicted Zn finger-like uncharacterized protein
MNLATRCPNCATIFRVQPGQLSARGGKVRCGKCHTVFDGVAALVEEDPATAANPQPEPSPQLALFEAARKAPRPAAVRAEPAGEEAPAPDFLAEEPPPPRHRLAWSLGSLAALAALAAQAVLYFRTEIAVLVPEARPVLAEACALLGCELRLPRRPELMAIESSDLQADNRRESAIVLNAVIRNRAPFAQEYPSLELTLTDERDQAVLRRVLAPADYLQGAGAGRLAQGVAGGTEAALRVHLDTGGTRAVGYRLYLFYP